MHQANFAFPSRRQATAAALLALSLAATLVACGGNEEPADLVLRNGYVYTVDGGDSVAQAVAVRDGRITYVGSNAGLREWVGPRTKDIDLGGRMLMPGLVDGHIHTLGGASQTLKCSLDFLPLSVADMRTRIQACLDASTDQGADAWLEVVNWDRQAMAITDRDPVKADLDALTTTRPIIVTGIDQHSRFVNSRALALAGVDRNTPTPPGGVIAKDANGEPTGMFEDEAASLLFAVIPQPSDADRVQYAHIALDLLRRQGVTSFMDALSGEDMLKAFATVASAGELSARPQFALSISAAEAADPAQAMSQAKAVAQRYAQRADGTAPVLQVRHVKVFLDGVLQAPAQTAFLLAPYHVNLGTAQAPDWQPGTHVGASAVSLDTLKALALEAAKAGLDTHVHAIGDASVRMALDAAQHVRQQLPGTKARPSIAHAELVDPADFGRFKALDVTPVMSFQWMQRAPYSVDAVQDQLGPQRFARMEPEGSLHAAGARIAYGSDWPVDPLAHWYNLRVGVTRSGDPSHPASFGPAYAGRLNDEPLLPRAAVLRSVTMNSAYSMGVEGQVGSIEKGKLADLIVLDRNFMTAAEDELAHTQVLLTLVAGQSVWSSGPFLNLLPAARQDTAARGAAAASGARRLQVLNSNASLGHTATAHGDGHGH